MTVRHSMHPRSKWRTTSRQRWRESSLRNKACNSDGVRCSLNVFPFGDLYILA